MSESIRRAGIVGAVGGALTAVSGVLVTGVVAPSSDVSDDMWSYPWSAGAVFTAVCVAYAAFHALVIVGIRGFARSGAAGAGRGARIGTAVAVAGTAMLLLAELLSIPVADKRIDDTGSVLVTVCFALGTLVSAIGFLVAGVTTIRAARWDGWRRYTPLALGIWTIVLNGLAPTPLLPTGVAVYGVLLTALGVAVATRPAPSPARPRTTAVQV